MSQDDLNDLERKEGTEAQDEALDKLETLNKVSQNTENEITNEQNLEEVGDISEESEENKDTHEALEENNLQELNEEKSKKRLFRFKISSIKPESLSSSIIYTISTILIILIITSMIVFAVIIHNIKKNELKLENAKSTESLIDGTSVYINSKQILDGQTVTLSKVITDQYYSYFYFEDFIDTLKFDLYLVDQNNVLYTRDLTFNATNIDDYKNVFRFESIKEDSELLKLYVINNTDQSFTFYSILIPEGTPLNKMKIFNKEIKASFDDFNIVITKALFSQGVSSQIDYIIENNNYNSYTIQSGLDEQNTSISLLENGSELKNLTKYPFVYNFSEEGVQFNKMEFSGVSSLKSKLTLCLNNLYKKYNVNSYISYSEIQGSKQKTIPFGNYNLVIENLGKFDDKIVLVLHSEDPSISNSNDETENRFKTIVDVDAIIKTSTGMQLILNGEAKSSEIGTDVIFKINPEYSEFLSDSSLNDVQINLKSIYLKIEDAYLDINLEEAMERQVVEDEVFEEEVLNYFKSRLLYKSGLIDLSSVKGFSQEILNDTSIMSDYTPNKIFPNAVYSSQMLFTAFYKNSIYYVVQDNWKESTDSINSFYRTHFVKLKKVSSNNSSESWVIVSDTIIR